MYLTCLSGLDVEAAGEARLQAVRAEVEAWIADPAGEIGTQEAQIAAIRAREASQIRLEAQLLDVVGVGGCGPSLEAMLDIGRIREARGAWYRELPPIPVAGPPELYRIGTGCFGPSYEEQAIRVYEQVMRSGATWQVWGDPSMLAALARLRALDPEGYPQMYEEIPGPGWVSAVQGGEGPVTVLE